MSIVEILEWRYRLVMMRHPKCQAPEYLPILAEEEQAFIAYFKDAGYNDGFHGGCKYNGVELRVIREST